MEEESQTGELQLGFKIFIGSNSILTLDEVLLAALFLLVLFKKLINAKGRQSPKEGNKISEIDQVEDCS